MDGLDTCTIYPPAMCCSSTFNPEVIFYNFHRIHFGNRALNILQIHNIQYFILKSGGSVHDQTNNSGTKLNLNNMYGNARIKWMRKHGTLKLIPAHMNAVLAEIWEYLKISSASITQYDLKKTHLIHIPPYEQDKKPQS